MSTPDQLPDQSPDKPPDTQAIVGHLQQVADCRAARAADAGLARRVLRLKRYQARRFELSYADLLADARHRPAARFFLDELYGPQDFASRDAQFSRIVPSVRRVFPAEVLVTVAHLAELHALSEGLDQAMAQAIPANGPLRAADYLRAWQATGHEPERRHQVALTRVIAQALEGFTRSRWLLTTLKLMRGPARAAGLGALQHFLESGFSAFAAMGGARHFLATVTERELALMAALFSPDAAAALRRTPLAGPLADLPDAVD